MNDQTSRHTSDQDFLETFPQSLAQLRSSVEQNDSVGALESARTLHSLFNQLLQSIDPNASYQVRSSLTEIHRLLRILNRDLVFWQGAKQTRADRSAQVLATLQSIEEFYQMLITG